MNTDNKQPASPTRRYGPSRGDLMFRICFAAAGLALTLAAVLFRGLPQGPGGWEAIIIAIVFFGGTLIWSLRRLLRGDHPDT